MAAQIHPWHHLLNYTTKRSTQETDGTSCSSRAPRTPPHHLPLGVFLAPEACSLLVTCVPPPLINYYKMVTFV